jgi:fructokinase
MTLWGAIEAGGTKWVCALGRGPSELISETRLATTTPRETIARAIAFFAPHAAAGDLAGVGIASFGPLDLDPFSPTHGFITSTPKPGWAQTDVVGAIGQALGVAIGFDTDVNAAALGEYLWGAGQGLDNLVYLTVGTGIGGGAIVGGRPVHGLVHPEMGHILIPHDRAVDPYAGFCPYHGDCLEGLAAGPAIEKRWGHRAEKLPPEHPAWNLEGHYLALGLANLICTLSPQRIILGGGVMKQSHLFPLVRRKVQEQLGGYVQAPQILQDIDHYIVPPGLGERSGLLGAMALAQRTRATSL